MPPLCPSPGFSVLATLLGSISTLLFILGTGVFRSWIFVNSNSFSVCRPCVWIYYTMSSAILVPAVIHKLMLSGPPAGSLCLWLAFAPSSCALRFCVPQTIFISTRLASSQPVALHKAVDISAAMTSWAKETSRALLHGESRITQSKHEQPLLGRIPLCLRQCLGTIFASYHTKPKPQRRIAI